MLLWKLGIYFRYYVTYKKQRQALKIQLDEWENS